MAFMLRELRALNVFLMKKELKSRSYFGSLSK